MRPALLHSLGGLCLALGLCACEAPLRLEGVAAVDAEPVKRYDMFQAAVLARTAAGSRAVVVSSAGAALVSVDGGVSWRRDELPGAPALIDVTACADSGEVFALDAERRVWRLAEDAQGWQSEALDTGENTLSIHCAPGGQLWVSASFATLFSRPVSEPDAGWAELSLGDDLQFTRVSFVDAQTGFAVGEFGTVIGTTDGGQSWDYLEPIPNDFYPMAADFLDADTGWVGGLDGVIWQTSDGGQSWQRTQTGSTTPIYHISAGPDGVIAVGGAGKYEEYLDGQWQRPANAPQVLAWFRAVEQLDAQHILLAGAGGAMRVLERQP